MWRCEDVRMRRCEDEQMWRYEDVKMSRRCEDVKMSRCEDVKMRGCEDEKMWRWEDVKMRRCEDVKWEDVKMRRCEDEKMWRWEDVKKMWRCEDVKWEDVKMRRCEDEKMWRWEDVKMRRCEDEKMWRWEGVKMKMWRWEDVKMRRCEDEKMRYRPPLLEEPCAQTLSGKKIKLAITSFCDKTLFKPTASASTGSGGPCNEHRQKTKSCGQNYETLMFHCSTLTISRINTSSALWFSDTQWQQLRQWWGSKMPLNHVEPFHFVTQLLTAWKDLVQTLHLPRQLQPQVTLQIPPPAERKKVLEGSEGIAMPKLDISRWPCTASTPTRPSTFFG